MMTRIFLEFMKIGLFSVGGGLATIPFLAEFGEKYGFFTLDELTTMIAVSESTPGPIGINMASFVGNRANGIFGAIITTFGLVIPSVVIIIMVANVLEKYKHSVYTQRILKMLKTVSIGLIIAAVLPIVLSLFKGAKTTEMLYTLVIIVMVFFTREKYKKLHPIYILLVFFILGLGIDLLL
ncbi:MAG: chromate transporter [Ezakiella sp.]|nr:chromate transporter [Ezakiella sp.]MDD7471347.1 chromate transporter [Bacillota bacterium]MDY3923558.1 chromate transporter [Ezakiella sp.]